MNVSLVFFSAVFMFLTACENSSFVVNSNSIPEVTDKNITPENPKEIKESQILIGYLQAVNLKIQINKISKHYELIGNYKILNQNNEVAFESELNLKGELVNTGTSNLRSSDAKSLARLTCLEYAKDGYCHRLITDIYIKYHSKVLSTQVVVELENEALPKPKEIDFKPPTQKIHPEQNQDTNQVLENDTDFSEDEGLYVGTLHEDPTPYFDEKNSNKDLTDSKEADKLNHDTTAPVTTEPKLEKEPETKTKPVPNPTPEKQKQTQTPDNSKAMKPVFDQAVGQANNGHLEKATNLLHEIEKQKITNIQLLNQFRKRYFGTTEIVHSLVQTAIFLKEISPFNKLSIGDISAQNGGRLADTHKSHQNGIDVDVAYLRSDVASSEFSSMVNGKDVLPVVKIRELYQVFEFLHVTLKVTDRIFIHPKIKNSLCEFAKSTHLLTMEDRKADASEVLRRLRPMENHDDHFHLRIQCPKTQPRCRNMGQPPSGTGC